MQDNQSLRIPYYRLHPGRNRFCCHGRGVFSRDMCIFTITLLLIISVTVLFFAFDCRFLTPILTPAVPILAAMQFLYVVTAFLRTAFTDPGIIPRATRPEVEWTELSISKLTSLIYVPLIVYIYKLINLNSNLVSLFLNFVSSIVSVKYLTLLRS